MNHILLIDDDTDMSDLFQSILTTDNFDVEIANDGATGIAKAKTGKFNLILLDIMMPTMNGIDVLDQIKATPEVAATPVVMFSNFADEKYHQLATKKGAALYLVKSDHDPDDLIAILNDVLAKAGSTPSTPSSAEPAGQ